jgi:histone acetyltransferase (RNA polymerase elongator complex component)
MGLFSFLWQILSYNLVMNIIPIFLPYAGCKTRCVFCNEIEATGQKKPHNSKEIKKVALKYREYFNDKKDVELAFYGGSFLNLPEKTLIKYCRTVQYLLNKDLISSVRFSTTPESISREKVKLIKEIPISLIELGVQSLYEDVLEKSHRPHDVQDVYEAVRILRDEKIDYGIHLMTGLPGDTKEKSIISAMRTAELRPKSCRIHPTLVLKNTVLENLYEDGSYSPQTMEEAIETVMYMYVVLVSHSIKVNRMGLCLYGNQIKNVVTGPFHESFGELVKSRLSIEIVRLLVDRLDSRELVLNVDEKERQFFIGYKKWVKKWLNNEGITLNYSLNGYSIDIMETIKTLFDKIKRGKRFSFPGVNYEA